MVDHAIPPLSTLDRLYNGADDFEAFHAALDDVIDAVEGDGGHEPTDDELRELGIDPAENHHGGGNLPDQLCH